MGRRKDWGATGAGKVQTKFDFCQIFSSKFQRVKQRSLRFSSDPFEALSTNFWILSSISVTSRRDLDDLYFFEFLFDLK